MNIDHLFNLSFLSVINNECLFFVSIIVIITYDITEIKFLKNCFIIILNKDS